MTSLRWQAFAWIPGFVQNLGSAEIPQLGLAFWQIEDFGRNPKSRPQHACQRRLVKLGGPLAATQPIEKFFSKPDFGGPSGLPPPG